MDTTKESLQTFKVFRTFPHDESFSMLFARFIPTLGNFGCAASKVIDAQQLEASLSKKAFVLARRYEKIESDRASNCELFMR